MARRFGPFGGGGPGPRMFERGYLKYALLELLQEQPKHGYEMMKDLEDRMGGFYAPSAGAIYPTLQLLEDRGWVTVETADGKKVYTITDEGRQALAEQTERMGARREHGPQAGPFGEPRGHEHHHGPHEHHHGPESGPLGGPRGERREHGGRGPWGDWDERGGRRGPGFGPRFGPGFGPGFGRGEWRGQPEARALAHEVREVGRLMLMAGMQSINQPERLAQLKGIVERTHGEIEAFLAQSSSASGAAHVSHESQPDTAASDDGVDMV